MPEGVAGHFLALGLEFGDNGLHTRAFGNEEVYGIDLVHHGAQARGLGGEVHRHFRDKDAVNVEAGAIQTEGRQPFTMVEHPAVGLRRGGGEPPAVAPHHLVDDEHAGIGIILGDHVPKITGPLFGGRPGTQGLPDRIDIVIDRLGQPYYRETIIVLGQERGQIRGRSVGVVPPDGMQHVDPVLDELVCRDLLRILAFFDQAALEAILEVGQLHAAIADGRAAKAVQHMRPGPNLRCDRVAVAQQQALVASAIADDLDTGVDLTVPFNQPARGGTQAGREPARG